MPTQLQLRRGTTTEHSSFSGAVGEVTVDTNKDTLIVHDGATNGGFPLAKETGTTFGNTDVSGTLSFADNSKAAFGNAADLQVFHDGLNSYVKEVGDGDLILQGVANVKLQGGGTNEDMVVAAQNGAVTLYHNNSPKIATTDTGIDITGGFDATAGSTITTADNTTQLTLLSTDDSAAEGPRLDLRRNSSSPADGDIIGTVRYNGENSDGTNLVFSEIQTTLSDVTAGTVDASLDLFIRRDNTLVSGMSLNPTQAVFNEGGNDVDFRVESDGQTNALFLNGNTSNFGINRSPTYELDVGANDTNGSVSGRIIAGTDSGASAIFRIHAQATAGARTSSLYFGDNANGGIGRVEYYHADDSMRFNTNNAERMRITGGAVEVTGTISSNKGSTGTLATFTDGVNSNFVVETSNLLTTIGNGGGSAALAFKASNTERMRILAGGGITFNGDTAVANALDDYEEGTWTPTGSTNDGSNPSFESANGKYVKIGKMVHVTGFITNIDTTGTTGTSQLRVTGLPYTIDDIDTIGSITWNSVTMPYSQGNVQAETNEYLLFYSSNPDANNTRQIVDFQHLTDDVSDIQFSITYYTDQ